MTSLVSGRSGTVMANESDPNWWIAVIGGVVAIASAFAGWVIRGLKWASNEGQTAAKIEGRFILLEERLKLSNQNMADTVSALRLSIAAIETHREDLEVWRRQVVVKADLADMKKEFTDRFAELRQTLATSRRYQGD